MKVFYAIAVGSLMMACSSGPEKTVEKKTGTRKGDLASAVKEVKLFEDSLKRSGMQYSQETAVLYAEKCLSVAHRFPKSPEAPRYMDKAHIIFASSGLHQRSVVIADSLIAMYPVYKNRPMVLESLAGAYDVFVVPRQKDKVKKYYELLLKESPDMKPEQRKQIEDRLKYIDLTFDEYVSKAN
ncbi:hypothetical protein [Fluviicola sp.]|uniref:hypothetical protein n=1 Tax=Fluviicola sp. TaxID=1917219 RepID=UPI0031D21A7B